MHRIHERSFGKDKARSAMSGGLQVPCHASVSPSFSQFSGVHSAASCQIQEGTTRSARSCAQMASSRPPLVVLHCDPLHWYGSFPGLVNLSDAESVIKPAMWRSSRRHSTLLSADK